MIYELMSEIFQWDICTMKGKNGSEDINTERLYEHCCKSFEINSTKRPYISKEEIEDILSCFETAGVISERKKENGSLRYAFLTIISRDKKELLPHSEEFEYH